MRHRERRQIPLAAGQNPLGGTANDAPAQAARTHCLSRMHHLPHHACLSPHRRTLSADPAARTHAARHRPLCGQLPQRLWRSVNGHCERCALGPRRLGRIKAGTSLRTGDEVRVISIPAKAPKKPSGKRKRSALMTGIVVLAGLGFLTAINSWGGHTVPITNVEDPLGVTKTTIVADGSDSVTITAIVTYDDGSPVRNDTPIIFRITAGRGELDATATQVQALTIQGAATVTLTTVDETSPPIVVTAIPRKGDAGMTPPIVVTPAP